MSYDSGSNYKYPSQDKKEKKQPVLVSDEEMLDNALKEAGKIMGCAFEMLGASGTVKADIIYGIKKYKITFKRIQ